LLIKMPNIIVISCEAGLPLIHCLQSMFCQFK
jgi:hypothetical protein